MDKMQVEKNCDLSQKITYEEISVILQAIYPSLTGHSIKKMEFLSGFFKTMCKQ